VPDRLELEEARDLVRALDVPAAEDDALDVVGGGALELGVHGSGVPRRRYLPGTLVLESRFELPEGELVAHDFLALGASEGRDPGGLHPHHLLVRLVRCEGGEASVRLCADARPNYGRAGGRWRRGHAGHTLDVPGCRLVLSCDAPVELVDGVPTGDVHLGRGERMAVGLAYAEGAPGPASPDLAEELLDRTVEAWRAWSGSCRYDGYAREQVVHSAVVLRGLIFDESGALLAAPTTSLPEVPGGVRNWDYRYTWHRDASLMLLALFRLGFHAEGRRYKDFLVEHETLVDDCLDPLIGIGGEHDLEERELEHLEGYASSRPVRIGNGARGQLQLDSAGYLLDAVLAYRDLTGELERRHWEEVRAVVDATARGWRRADQGIWEIRGEPRHHTHSKVLAWTCLDRGVRLAEAVGDTEAPLEHWRSERDAVHAEVLERGYDQQLDAFVQSYGSRALDAALIQASTVGFLPGTDARIVGTLDAIAAGLGCGPAAPELIRRYDVQEAADGLPGEEGAFLMCSFELVSALVLAGRADEARERFEHLVARAGPLGLFAEEMAADGVMLGNYPQAFTHLALVEAAVNLDERSEREALHRWAGESDGGA
jgi:alpha,alpha-trehalase